MDESKRDGVSALADAFAHAEQRKNFFFEPPSRLQLLEKLEHLSRFSDFLLLVTGPEGAGKSVLIRQLQAVESDRTLRLCAVDGAKTHNLHGVLVSLSQQLSPELDIQADNQQMLNAIYSFAQVMAVEHIQWVIIIDNADQLENPVIQLLLQMLSEAQGLPLKPHLLMAAGERFLGRLESFDEYALLESQVHQLILEPFTYGEAKNYLLQRYSATASLTEKQLQAVYDTSGGYPGRLNQQVEVLFRSGTVNKVSDTSGFSRMHLASIAAVLLLVLVVGLWQYWPESDTGTTRTQVQIQVPIETAPEVVTGGDTLPVTTPGVPTIDVTEATDQVINVEPPVVMSDTEVSLTAADKAAVAQPDRQSADAGASLARVEVGITAEVEPGVKPTTPVTEKAAASVATQPKPAIVAKADPVKVKPAAVVKSTITVENSLTEAEQNLMRWPASGYTLQMLGAGMKTSAEEFIRAQAEPQKFYMFQTRYKDKPWYVVVYGQYKDRDAAHAASASLPSALAKLKPWARTIQGIQADIATRK
ncbi:SPOR domain-containing protein [Amphritea sp.]|uniref:SPOR domain-containing protein n=1 Tax=Amphritea sp. TaxID=1872502 RepID=UPI003D13EF0E